VNQPSTHFNHQTFQVQKLGASSLVHGKQEFNFQPSSQNKKQVSSRRIKANQAPDCEIDVTVGDHYYSQINKLETPPMLKQVC
jgi:hypothetical protein